MNVLQLEELHVAYNGQPALRSISLSIAQGEIVAIVGESGCGKTTLLKTIAHFLPPNADVSMRQFQVAGESMQHATSSDWQRILGRHISVIFQNPLAFFSPVKKIQNHFIRSMQNHHPLSKKEIIAQSVDMLCAMNFTEDEAKRILRSYPFQLSGGMMQRVSIALAMLVRPKLLLADEPTSALDVVTQKQILDELLRMREATTSAIMMITHDISAALYIADRIIVMQQGQIVEHGTPQHLLHHAVHPYTKHLLNSAKEAMYATA